MFFNVNGASCGLEENTYSVHLYNRFFSMLFVIYYLSVVWRKFNLEKYDLEKIFFHFILFSFHIRARPSSPNELLFFLISDGNTIPLVLQYALIFGLVDSCLQLYKFQHEMFFPFSYNTNKFFNLWQGW